MISSYPSVYNLGHKILVDLFNRPVILEEKCDGSQYSFSLGTDGILRARSKGAELHLEAPEKMFQAAVATVIELNACKRLRPGWTYRCEYLAKPKHNALAYDRIPNRHLIIFDIDRGDQDYLSPIEKRIEAERIGLEVVPTLYEGMVSDVTQFRTLLDTVSILGGQKVEGVVIKPADYALYGLDHKTLMGKFVSEEFREVASKAWSETNPTSADIITKLATVYGTQARWSKAVQHLRERGEIEDDVRDIGELFKEVPIDVLKECEDEIKDKLFEWGWPAIKRKLCHGLPDYYKEELLKKQFDK
jgi:hypothetical protein